jgi:hypothetical protein
VEQRLGKLSGAMIATRINTDKMFRTWLMFGKSSGTRIRQIKWSKDWVNQVEQGLGKSSGTRIG